MEERLEEVLRQILNLSGYGSAAAVSLDARADLFDRRPDDLRPRRELRPRVIALAPDDCRVPYRVRISSGRGIDRGQEFVEPYLIERPDRRELAQYRHGRLGSPTLAAMRTDPLHDRPPQLQVSEVVVRIARVVSGHCFEKEEGPVSIYLYYITGMGKVPKIVPMTPYRTVSAQRTRSSNHIV